MNILYVTAEIPYALSGYLRHFHLVQGLAAHHAITLVSLTRRGGAAPEAVAALAPFVERLEVLGADRSGGGRLRRALRLRLAARGLRRRVAAHLAAGDQDVVVISGKDTFPALGATNGVPVVVDVCDAASVRLRRELGVARRRRLTRAVRLVEIEHIERRLLRSTPHVLFASARDRDALGAAHGMVVPNGVDLRYWTRRARLPSAPVVAFTGVMSYRPNHDAALRLVNAVMPRVRALEPEAATVVAGRDPLPALRASAGPGATVTGACPDLRPHLEGAAVYCAPLRFASGIQNKLLEALAMELPVVTTSVAAAGLRAGDEAPPLVIADDDEALALAVVRLLRDPGGRARLGAAGRRYVERHFSWSRSVALLDEALRTAAGAGR
jgi:glycosyltransferase involved in cell wall biosynthesis